MNVKQLKEMIGPQPDDMPVLIPGYDHSYQNAGAEITTALKERGGTWTEDHGEKLTPQKQFGKRVSALVFYNE